MPSLTGPSTVYVYVYIPVYSYPSEYMCLCVLYIHTYGLHTHIACSAVPFVLGVQVPCDFVNTYV